MPSLSTKERARQIQDDGMDAAIDIIRTHRNQPREHMVNALQSNGAVVRLVTLMGTALTPSGMLIMLRHRHSQTHGLESAALDAWMNQTNKAETEKTIRLALQAIHQRNQP